MDDETRTAIAPPARARRLRDQLPLALLGLVLGASIGAAYVAIAGDRGDRTATALDLVGRAVPNPIFTGVEACDGPDGEVAFVTGYVLGTAPDGSGTGSVRFKVTFPEDGPAVADYAPANDDWFAMFDAASAQAPSCYDRFVRATAGLLDQKIATTRAEMEDMQEQLKARMGSP